VYVLTNQKNGKQYVGVSQNPFKRLKQHANPRKKKQGLSLQMQLMNMGWKVLN
jgi:predicted GIY-YIG superfamily endonuclease